MTAKRIAAVKTMTMMPATMTAARRARMFGNGDSKSSGVGSDSGHTF